MSMLNLSLDMEKVLPPPTADVGEGSGELDIGLRGSTGRWVHGCVALGGINRKAFDTVRILRGGNQSVYSTDEFELMKKVAPMRNVYLFSRD
jgi:hypothetical protein